MGPFKVNGTVLPSLLMTDLTVHLTCCHHLILLNQAPSSGLMLNLSCSCHLCLIVTASVSSQQRHFCLCSHLLCDV